MRRAIQETQNHRKDLLLQFPVWTEMFSQVKFLFFGGDYMYLYNMYTLGFIPIMTNNE